jgi:hypothetical protein
MSKYSRKKDPQRLFNGISSKGVEAVTPNGNPMLMETN